MFGAVPDWYVHLQVCRYLGLSPSEGERLDLYWYRAALLAMWAERQAARDRAERG